MHHKERGCVGQLLDTLRCGVDGWVGISEGLFAIGAVETYGDVGLWA